MYIDSILASSGYSLLKLALDASNLRHQTIANNIANIDTKDYQPLRVSFEEQLQQELTSSGAKNTVFKTVPRIEQDTRTDAVSLDQEMISLNKNFIHYQALIKLTNGKMELANLAINDGKR